MLKETFAVRRNGHTFIYRFGPNQAGLCVRRVYVDSRHPVLGFSLALVFKAMSDLS